MAGEDKGDGLAAMWRVKLQDVQRLDADDPEDHDDTFAVDFELQSPGVNGSVSVMVPGGVDETRLVGQAREIMRAALERWADVTGRTPCGERIDPTGE